MAEETKRKVQYNGQEFDEDLVNFSGRYADQYATHKHMNQAQRDAFMAELNARHQGMLSGQDGNVRVNNDTIYTGAITGRQKKKARAWNGMDRDAFNAADAVDQYLMGMSGRYKSLQDKNAAATAEREKANLPAWNRHTGEGGSTLDTYLSNMWGNNLDMVDWANSSGDVYSNGVRGRSGRYAKLKETLSKYEKDLQEGKYGDSDEIQNELALLRGALYSNPSDIDSKYKALLGNRLFDQIMFTGEKYMTPQEQEQARIQGEQGNRIKALQDYINGVKGAKNPYEQGTPEYNAAELQRQNAEDERFNQGFGKDEYTNPEDFEFSTVITDSIGPDVFTGWNSADMRSNLDAMYGAGANEYGYDRNVSNLHGLLGWIPGIGEFGHNDKAGWTNDGAIVPGGEDTSLEGTIYDPYLNALNSGNDDQGADDFHMTMSPSEKNARSTNAVKAKAAMDYARHLVSQGDHNMFQTKDGYVLPEFIDWNTGSAYIFNFNPGDRRGRAKRVNINAIINSLDKTSPIYKSLLNEWRRHKGRVALNKEGGVIKAASGAPLSDKEKTILTGQNQQGPLVNPKYNTDYQGFQGQYNAATPEQKQAELDARYATAQANGVPTQTLIDRNASTEFSTTDYARIGTAVADLTGAVLSLTGFSPAGAAVGAASTLTQFGLDIADGDVGMTDALKALGVGLTLDAMSLIPGNGASGILKAVKSLSKYAVPIISTMQVMGNSAGAIETAKKVFSGNIKGITVGEWKEFTKALNGITNATPMAKVAYSKRFGKLKGVNKPEGGKAFDFEVNGSKVQLTEKDIAEINGATDPLVALRTKFTQANPSVTPEQAEQLITSGVINTPNKFVGKWLGRKPSLNTGAEGFTPSIAPASVQNQEAYLAALNRLQAQREATIAAGQTPGASLWTRAKGAMTQRGLDDAGALFGSRGLVREIESTNDNIINSKQAARAEEIRKLQDTLKSQNLKPLDRRKVQARLTKLQQDYNTLGGDTELARLQGLEAASQRRISNVDKLRGIEERYNKAKQNVADNEAAVREVIQQHDDVFNDPVYTQAKDAANHAFTELENLRNSGTATPEQLAAAENQYNSLLSSAQSIENELSTKQQELAQEIDRLMVKLFDSKRWRLIYERALNGSSRPAHRLNRPNQSGILEQLGIGQLGDKTPLQRWQAMSEELKSNLGKEAKQNLDNLAKLKEARQKATEYNTVRGRITKQISSMVDPRYRQGIKVADSSNFERMLQDLTDKGYTEVQIQKMLQRGNLLEQLRAIYRFKRGGVVNKYWDGGWIKNMMQGASNLNAITGIEITKHAGARYNTDKATRMITDQAPLQFSYTPQNYTISTSNVKAPYDRLATQTRSTANNIANQTSDFNSQASIKLRGNQQANEYELKGADVINNWMNQEANRQMQVDQYNNKLQNEFNRQNTQLKYSKEAANRDLLAKQIQFNGGQDQKLLTQLQNGIAQSRAKVYAIHKHNAILQDPAYMEAKDAYDEAFNLYNQDTTNTEAQTAASEAKKKLNRVILEFGQQWDISHPTTPTIPFAYSIPGNTYDGDFINTKTFLKEGGEIGKMTQAELVKLIRERERIKFKDRDSYRKYLDKYAERMHKANSSTAYQAYIKLLNSK